MAAVAVQQVSDLLKDGLHISPKTVASRPQEKNAAVPQQPDIGYDPDETKWKARTARRLLENPSLPNTPLPEGFPKKLVSPLMWEGKDWTEEKQWVYEMTPEHLKEIDEAVKHFRSLGKPFGHVKASTFPLPTLGPVLTELARELHTGRGFFVLRTIPVDSYSREENGIIYAGISSYVGNLRAVQDTPAVIAHITDLTKREPSKTLGAPAYTTDKQVFHTDLGDIIGLFALEVAVEGGTSRISSTWRAYNELAETRPDLIKTLAEPWVHDGFGRSPAYIVRPLMFHHDSKISIQYARRMFTGFLALPRSADIPPITDAQAEALDALHFLGEKYHLALNFQKGDIQYINNLGIFHTRDAFVDGPEQKRHLLRMWLRNEELGWATPPELQELWQQLYHSVSPDDHTFPLEAAVRKQTIGGVLKKD
ncbi:hypothetical protein H0H81_012613 [Sphagnurus paluster]|uniref:TauD/TfdA-like domain-containing protein n=1 Tax=Sphagnurus paluster TaxID=117069 RepID=A0A9P7GGQ7_9AGAR|nr:hypothetical protein H0H81_012613 [Sphagnurus paluster]